MPNGKQPNTPCRQDAEGCPLWVQAVQKHKTTRAGGKSHRFSQFSDTDMGNQNLIWETFVANVERCPIGYEIRRVFTQPGSVAAL